jgi:hypothetical protein
MAGTTYFQCHGNNNNKEMSKHKIYKLDHLTHLVPKDFHAARGTTARPMARDFSPARPEDARARAGPPRSSVRAWADL